PNVATNSSVCSGARASSVATCAPSSVRRPRSTFAVPPVETVLVQPAGLVVAMSSAASAGARLTSPWTVWLMEVLPSSVPAVKSATVVSVNAAGVEPAPVVNENATSAAKALPARSLTRGSNTPPWTIARYGAWADRPRAGVRVAAWLPASYAMAATTGRLNASLSSNVVPATVDGSSASLNVTTIGAAAST